MDKEELDIAIESTEFALANCLLRIAACRSGLDFALKREKELRKELEKRKSERRKLEDEQK